MRRTRNPTGGVRTPLKFSSIQARARAHKRTHACTHRQSRTLSVPRSTRNGRPIAPRLLDRNGNVGKQERGKRWGKREEVQKQKPWRKWSIDGPDGRWLGLARACRESRSGGIASHRKEPLSFSLFALSSFMYTNTGGRTVLLPTRCSESLGRLFFFWRSLYNEVVLPSGMWL